MIYSPTTAGALAYAPNGWSVYLYPTEALAQQKLPYPWVFSSRHPGGVNMLMGDGSVKFVKNSVSLYPWWASATINGGEVISADSF